MDGTTGGYFYLHYTLLLLIQYIDSVNTQRFKFTLHFATINTILDKNMLLYICKFTLHFATINTYIAQQKKLFEQHLHYTLLLLIL